MAQGCTNDTFPPQAAPLLSCNVQVTEQMTMQRRGRKAVSCKAKSRTAMDHKTESRECRGPQAAMLRTARRRAASAVSRKLASSNTISQPQAKSHKAWSAKRRSARRRVVMLRAGASGATELFVEKLTATLIAMKLRAKML